MPQALLIKVSTDHFKVSGELLMDTVMSVLNDMNDSLKSDATLHIDFSNVANSDSAAVALIVAWLAKAKQLDATVKLQNLPQQILDIAKASDLLDVLPIE